MFECTLLKWVIYYIINILSKLIYLIHYRPFDCDQVIWLWSMHNFTCFEELCVISHIWQMGKWRLQALGSWFESCTFINLFLVLKLAPGRARIWTLLFLTQYTDILIEGINNTKISTGTTRKGLKKIVTRMKLPPTLPPPPKETLTETTAFPQTNRLKKWKTLVADKMENFLSI